jgi:ketosteroid isomerase-like protein
MSEGNVEVVRTLLAAFDRADYEAALAALDPEVEWQVPPGIAIGREVYRGRDEVQREFAEWLAAWDAYRFEAEEMLDHGDHVVVGGMQIARGRGSGVEVGFPTFHVCSSYGFGVDGQSVQANVTPGRAARLARVLVLQRTGGWRTALGDRRRNGHPSERRRLCADG